MNAIQLELSEVIKMIDNEVRIDDDVSGGYLEEPFDKIVTKLYAIQEKLNEPTTETDTSKANLIIPDVSNSLIAMLEFLRSENIDVNYFSDEEIINKFKSNL